MKFETLGLHAALLRALADAGYDAPTPVQAQAVPAALAGADLMVASATGSGKTAAFVLPALQQLLEARAAEPQGGPARGVPQGPRALVLVPTRELALQVAKAAVGYGRYVQGLRVATVVGGVPYGAQLKALRGPLDLLIATPGRLMDHMASGKAVLSRVQLLVLDEADRMLDMGFIDDIHHIAQALPAARQTLMTSATFAGPVGRLAAELMRAPQRIEVDSHTDTHADIEQRLHWVDDLAHKNALLDHILTDRSVEQAVVFTSTQRDADWLADRLAEMGHAVAALHGGMPQGRRNRVLEGLRRRQLRVLVATDVAARGIDVPTISHVVNYGLPMKAEDYVHRIGRTGRAGRSGLAVTLAERRDFGMIQRIQRFTTQRIPAATIAGLEPRRSEPRPQARPAGPHGRPPRVGAGQRPFKPQGRPAPGGAPVRGARPAPRQRAR
ncbi:MAG: DEAD/DEAH box helicase [Burkholderiales bacterium]|nr:DEAD/DEAH box helicase [Burkholderiales bacterium]MCZ2441835.1 DEAD/DEAH box helicase [Burkholderiales bacterium]